MQLSASGAVTASTFSDSAAKIGNVVEVVAVFFLILLAVFFVAGRARGKFERPVAVVVFLVPAVLLLLIGLIIPAIRTIYYSFYGASSKTYVGTDNYKWAFTNANIRTVLYNTLLWIVVAPIAATALGLAIAMAVDRMKHQSIVKSLIFMPMVISFVGASIIWKFVYSYRESSQPQIGLLSQVVIALGWKHPPNWILSHPLNNFLLIVIMIWIQTGFAMVVLSAAIRGVPDEIIEAARVDGAHGLKLFRSVQIPLIRGTIVVVLTTIIIATLKVFDIVRTMTGGNFSTSVLANEMYNQSFVQFNVGHGSALAVILFLGVMPLVAYNVIQLRKERATQ
ncbi:MAG: alpha-glucoside transport system permease protein [Actinomycetota bacterium]|nr:alpha-glucoside transport system permease protein [Actinomycetota bacterium]